MGLWSSWYLVGLYIHWISCTLHTFLYILIFRSYFYYSYYYRCNILFKKKKLTPQIFFHSWQVCIYRQTNKKKSSYTCMCLKIPELCPISYLSESGTQTESGKLTVWLSDLGREPCTSVYCLEPSQQLCKCVCSQLPGQSLQKDLCVSVCARASEFVYSFKGSRIKPKVVASVELFNRRK